MINLGLARIRKLLAGTNISWKAVHIAGTNGKGSVSSIISSLLHASGVSVGRFNSPHLIDRWDCVTVNQQTVQKSVFLAAETFVKNRNERQGIGASEFEILTATAFEIFTDAKVHVGVVECGLGGRLDATNVLEPDQLLCSIITKIGMDHEALLGDTVVKIASEKAGILKKGRPFVVDQTNSVEILQAINETAKKAGAVQGQAGLSSVVEQLSNDTSDWPSHQQQNLGIALLAIHVIQGELVSHDRVNVFEEDGTLRSDRIGAIMASPTTWPGRLQLIDTKRITGSPETMLLDGAHNQQAAEALSKYIETMYRPHGRIVWVIAMSKGKKVKEFADALFQPGDEVIVTRFGPVDGMPWVQNEVWNVLVQSLPNIISIPIHIEPEPWFALRKAFDLTGGQKKVVICGSLYLVGDVLRLLRDKPPEELEGPKWRAWTKEQRRRLELRKQGVFE